MHDTADWAAELLGACTSTLAAKLDNAQRQVDVSLASATR